MVPENVVDGCGNDPLQEEPFPGPDNQSKMKRSVENADTQLTLVDLGLFTPTAGQYFRNERRRRHSQYDGGRTSSFQPFGQRFKGKNALIFYPEGSPTVAGALSQAMDISHRIEVCDTHKPYIVELGNYITIRHRPCFANSPNLQITFLNIFPDTLGDWPPQEGRPYEPPRFRSTWPDVMSEPPSCFETSQTRTANLLRRKLLVPLSGGPIACFDSGWPELFGDFVVSRSDPRRNAGECRPWSSGPTRGAPRSSPASGTEHRIERSMDVMVAARRSMYGADMLPRTTNFGVTPEEARELHQNQHRSDLKLVCLGLPGGCMMLSPFFWSVRFYVIVGGGRAYHLFFSNTTNFGVTHEEARELHEKQQAYNAANATAGKGAVTQQDGGIWDGTQTKHNNLI
ncbi:mei2-like protein [Fusarium sp. NRRL 25303]|nr:mei2-like protein [Fusarium sp. NRRL 25303]